MFTNPAHVRTLLVPINGCTLSEFHHYSSLIQSASEVRLLDITPAPLHFFNPQVFPNGRILFDIQTSPDESLFLHDLEPFRKTFIVIGVGAKRERNGELKKNGEGEKIGDNDEENIGGKNSDGNKCGKNSDGNECGKNSDGSDKCGKNDISHGPSLETPLASLGASSLSKGTSDHHLASLGASHSKETSDHLASLGDDLRRCFPNALVHSLILFNSTQSSSLPNIYLHSPQSPITAMETTMCDIARAFLIALDSYAKSYATITLRSPVVHSTRKALRRTSGTVPEKNSAHHRHSGRQAKLMGHLYLLAGRYPDALNSFSEAIVHLRRSDDYLWLGGAWDGLGVCIVLLEALESEWKLPEEIRNLLERRKRKKKEEKEKEEKKSMEKEEKKSMEKDEKEEKGKENEKEKEKEENSMEKGKEMENSEKSENSETGDALSPRTSLSSLGSLREALKNTPSKTLPLSLPHLIWPLSQLVIQAYDASMGDHENQVPDVVFADAVLRLGSYMAAHKFSPLDVVKVVDRIWSLGSWGAYGELEKVYKMLGMERRRAFVVFERERKRNKKEREYKNKERMNKDGNISQRDRNVDLSKCVHSKNVHSSHVSDSFSFSDPFSHRVSLSLAFLRRQANLSSYCRLLSEHLPSLSKEEQISLHDRIVKSRGRAPLAYWDPHFVRGVSFEGREDTLVPLAGAAEPAVPLVVCGEVQHVTVHVQNPFAFAVEVKDLVLVGNLQTLRFWVKGGRRSISPCSRDQIVVAFKPEEGRVDIWGVEVVVDCCDRMVYGKSEGSPVNAGGIKGRLMSTTIDKTINAEGINCGINGSNGINDKGTINEGNEKGINDKGNSTNDDDFKGTINAYGINVALLSLFSIPPQPLLVLSNTSVSNGWLMLLEGEQHEFSLTLSNTSPVEVNYLSFSFWDSSTESLRARFSTAHTLAPPELYELEWALFRFKPFEVIKNEIDAIGPRGAVTIGCRVHARRGITEGELVLEYANKGGGYGKELRVPLALTVVGGVEVGNTELIEHPEHSPNNLHSERSEGCFVNCPNSSHFERSEKCYTNLHSEQSVECLSHCPNSSHSSKQIGCGCQKEIVGSEKVTESEQVTGSEKSTEKTESEQVTENIEKLSIHGHSERSEECNCSFNYRDLKVHSSLRSECNCSECNSECNSLCIDFRNSYHSPITLHLSSPPFSTTQTILPNKTTRIFIPFSPIVTDVTRPIPSLSNRQFIKNSMSEREEMDSRLVFWVRNHIIDSINASWTCGRRKGTVDLRAIRLTPSMAAKMVRKQVSVRVFVENARVDEFCTVKVVIRNTGEPIRGMLRHCPLIGGVPVSDRHVLVNGVMQKMVWVEEVLEVQLGVCFLERGEYEWGVLFGGECSRVRVEV